MHEEGVAAPQLTRFSLHTSATGGAGGAGGPGQGVEVRWYGGRDGYSLLARTSFRVR